ncbi:MAG TPA: hypothetical protein VFB66_01960 [Tepidisphaeraceae bacterium]|nr:hypothetical protein [Tepidisphaeraceae bacterium]
MACHKQEYARPVRLTWTGIDAGYLDLFFRDEWMFKAVWDYRVAKGMEPTRYKRLESACASGTGMSLPTHREGRAGATPADR